MGTPLSLTGGFDIDYSSTRSMKDQHAVTRFDIKLPPSQDHDANMLGFFGEDVATEIRTPKQEGGPIVEAEITDDDVRLIVEARKNLVSVAMACLPASMRPEDLGLGTDMRIFERIQVARGVRFGDGSRAGREVTVNPIPPVSFEAESFDGIDENVFVGQHEMRHPYMSGTGESRGISWIHENVSREKTLPIETAAEKLKKAVEEILGRVVGHDYIQRLTVVDRPTERSHERIRRIKAEF